MNFPLISYAERETVPYNRIFLVLWLGHDEKVFLKYVKS